MFAADRWTNLVFALKKKPSFLLPPPFSDHQLDLSGSSPPSIIMPLDKQSAADLTSQSADDRTPQSADFMRVPSSGEDMLTPSTICEQVPTPK